MEDALLAQLLGMGFETDDIEACQTELAARGGYSLQEATEWLLQRQQQTTTGQSSSNRLVLSAPKTVAMETKPMSSSSDLTSQPHNQPLQSRYTLNEDHNREKERFAAKEREEAIKSAKMRRLADIKARQQIKQQIQEDRRAKQERQSKPSTQPNVSHGAAGPSQSHDSQMTKSHDTCRVQIRLPDGRVLRESLPPTARLFEVVECVRGAWPDGGAVHLIQPYPHHEFTEDEYQSSLQALNLCPSTSLVVARQPKVGGALNKPHPQTINSGSDQIINKDDNPSNENPFKQRRVMVDAGQSPEVRGQRVRFGGYRLGDGSVDEQPMDVRDNEDDEIMDQDDDSRYNVLPLPQGGPPPLGRPHPLAHGAHRVVPNWLPQAGLGLLPALGISDSGGNRLGGKESVMAGDLQQQALKMREAARKAAIRRSQAPAPHSHHTVHTLKDCGPPSLEELSTRTLLTLSSSYGLPSCGRLSPLVAHRLIRALKNEKKLNTKTLAAFHGCPLQSLELDNYMYATNELLQALCHFPSLTALSLSSCSIFTDRAITSLLPYLHGLTSLNLNGCRQLDEVICRTIRRCGVLEILKLSEVKVTDKGFSLLLTTPITHLRELDISKTQITTKSLDLLPAGTPNLESLSIEGTVVDQFSVLSQLPQLSSLNIAHCPSYSDVGTLVDCRGLRSLSLTGLCVETTALEKLATGLQLESLKLPDRNYFSDDGLKVVSAFPLTNLNLMDYCHVTDEGISHVGHMTSLQVLTLSRTKLTDQGMPYLTGLSGLRELSLDNTMVTDSGAVCLSSLVRLEVLSLSDTRVTSLFLLEGTLDPLGMLSRLNLSRTFVCDRGLARLQLPSLTMLNVNWTCITERSSLETLQEGGCPQLEVLGNSNIGQPLPGQPNDNDEDSNN